MSLDTSLTGAAFPFQNGDLVRFNTAVGGLLPNTDYYVSGRIVGTGTFQLRSTPNSEGPLVVITAAVPAVPIFCPGNSSADGIVQATAVQLSGNGSGGLDAASALILTANANQSLSASSESVSGASFSGLNRLGALGRAAIDPYSSVLALAATPLRRPAGGNGCRQRQPAGGTDR
jgi:hypothetical protein